MRICIWGDSIANGYNDFEKGGWVERLSLRFWNTLEYKGPNVMNLGISGDTSADVRKRFPVEFGAREPEIVVFAVGINDSVYDEGGDVRATKEEMADNLESCSRIAQEEGAEVIIVGLTPVIDSMLQPFPWSDSGKCYATKYVKEYDETLESLATKIGADYISLFDEVKETELPDGLHPDGKAHECIAEKVYAVLLQKLSN